MLNVFFTVDVELWPEKWDPSASGLAEALRRWVYGETASGDYGLPITLEVLNDHGLTGSFFVEALFASVYGIAPLQEIVGGLLEGKQDVQLHLHTEWVERFREPLLPGRSGQHMRHFTEAEQQKLLRHGLDNLAAAGVPDANAFRAGSFGLNLDTLRAMATVPLVVDTSYNPCLLGPTSGVLPGRMPTQPFQVEGVYEYPVTVFRDYPGHLRPAHLNACSADELLSMLRQARDGGWDSFVIVSHSFEMLDASLSRPDPVVFRRFEKLCQFLDRHRTEYMTSGFGTLIPRSISAQPPPLTSHVGRTMGRLAEQMYRRGRGGKRLR